MKKIERVRLALNICREYSIFMRMCYSYASEYLSLNEQIFAARTTSADDNRTNKLQKQVHYHRWSGYLHIALYVDTRCVQDRNWSKAKFNHRRRGLQGDSLKDACTLAFPAHNITFSKLHFFVLITTRYPFLRIIVLMHFDNSRSICDRIAIIRRALTSRL